MKSFTLTVEYDESTKQLWVNDGSLPDCLYAADTITDVIKAIQCYYGIVDLCPSPDEFREDMERVSHYRSPEDSHRAGDALMLQLLTSLGYSDGADIFNSMRKWYA